MRPGLARPNGGGSRWREPMIMTRAIPTARSNARTATGRGASHPGRAHGQAGRQPARLAAFVHAGEDRHEVVRHPLWIRAAGQRGTELLVGDWVRPAVVHRRSALSARSRACRAE